MDFIIVVSTFRFVKKENNLVHGKKADLLITMSSQNKLVGDVKNQLVPAIDHGPINFT